MASIFKRGRDEGKRGSCWWINYKDSDGKRRRKKGFTEKQRTEQLAAQLESDAKAIRDGLVDQSDLIALENKRLPIAQHVAAYRLHLGRNKQTTEKHITLVVGRIERTIESGGFESLSEMTHERVESAIAKMRDTAEILKREENKGRGFGATTFNHYLSAFESFGRWLYESHRVDANPFRGFHRMNTHVDVRKQRRSLTPTELSQLIQAARNSTKTIQCYDGETRARIYTVAALTGLRRSEIATLTPKSFTGVGKDAMLKVLASCSKHRREDNIPVHRSLSSQLHDWLIDAEPDKPLFPKLDKRKTFRMIAKDLEQAGIAYKNDDGDADFHALRHTFISQLLQDGATVIEAKNLARHSDVQMTMRYSHVEQKRQRDALDKLEFGTIQDESGTTLGPHVCHNVSPVGHKENQESEKNDGLDKKKPPHDSDCHEVAINGNVVILNVIAEDTGVEPATHCWAIDFESTC